MLSIDEWSSKASIDAVATAVVGAGVETPAFSEISEVFRTSSIDSIDMRDVRNEPPVTSVSSSLVLLDSIQSDVGIVPEEAVSSDGTADSEHVKSESSDIMSSIVIAPVLTVGANCAVVTTPPLDDAISTVSRTGSAISTSFAHARTPSVVSNTLLDSSSTQSSDRGRLSMWIVRILRRILLI